MQSKQFAYARVSSKDQNLDRQIKEFIDIGLDDRDIYIEKQSGKDFDRAVYQGLKRHLREGDTLYIKSLDRFGRDKEQILNEWHEITKVIKAHIVVLDMPLLDTSKYSSVSGLESLVADIVLQLLSFFAEEERLKIKERQREGIAAAKSNGKKFGRPNMQYPQEWEQYYSEWKRHQITAVEMCRRLNFKKSTFYKLVRIYEGREKQDTNRSL